MAPNGQLPFGLSTIAHFVQIFAQVRIRISKITIFLGYINLAALGQGSWGHLGIPVGPLRSNLIIIYAFTTFELIANFFQICVRSWAQWLQIDLPEETVGVAGPLAQKLHSVASRVAGEQEKSQYGAPTSFLRRFVINFFQMSLYLDWCVFRILINCFPCRRKRNDSCGFLVAMRERLSSGSRRAADPRK